MCAHGVYWLVDPSTSQALDGAMWVDSNPKDREHTTLDGLGWHESVTTISSPRVDEIRVASLVISPAKPAAYRLELCVLEPGETVKTHASTNTPFPISRLSTPTSPYSPTRGPKFFPARGDPLYRGGKVFPWGSWRRKKGGRSTEHDQQTSRLHGRVARCSLLAISKKEPGSYGENSISGKHMEGSSLPWKTIRGGPRITPTTVSMQWIPPPPSRLGW